MNKFSISEGSVFIDYLEVALKYIIINLISYVANYIIHQGLLIYYIIISQDATSYDQNNALCYFINLSEV